MLIKARKYTDNPHLVDSLKITISAVIPFLLLIPYEKFDWAFAAAIGAMLNAPVDIPGNLKDKTTGLLVGAFTIPAVTLVLSLSNSSWIFYPIFTFILFSLSMISVYGHRANMLSFTGLLALCLGLAHSYQGEELWIHCLMLLSGGLIYLIISLLFYFIRPRRYAILQTSECLNLTAEYLKYRGQLWDTAINRDKIIEEQLKTQVKLNEIHENLREYLVRNKANTGNSSNNRRLLVAFSSLVEIMEIAVSTSFDHDKLHNLFKDRPDIIKDYQVLAYDFTNVISNLGATLNIGAKYTPSTNLQSKLDALNVKLTDFVKTGNSPDMMEAVLTFSNVLHYAENQINQIKTLERILTEKTFIFDVENQFKDLEKFLTPVNYRWETLRENLNFNSTIFRHATRLTLTMLIGLAIGEISNAYFGLLNGYWILLTIVVIMRPGFGLTKQRSFERVIGTVIGGLFAFGLLYLIEDTAIIAYLTVLTMILGYWFSHTDYKVGVTFITIYVVLIYGILTPNFMDLLIFRIIDTLIGALLAFGANYLLWPSWEFLNVNKHLSKSLEANTTYLREISKLYNEKGLVTLPYKLARKYAFIEIGNLMASFQRMIQEPKSKQMFRADIYELAVLNHTFLSNVASIGIYIQSHPTSKASNAFNVVVDYTVRNLETATNLIKGKQIDSNLLSQEEENWYNVSLSYLKGIREYELKKTYSDDIKIKSMMEESILVIEQLIWLSNLSEKILKTSKSLSDNRKQLVGNKPEDNYKKKISLS